MFLSASVFFGVIQKTAKPIGTLPSNYLLIALCVKQVLRLGL